MEVVQGREGSERKVAVVLGVGPGLGMSIARRAGRAGYVPVLVSRSGARHPGYLKELADAGIEASSVVADVQDRAALVAALDTAEDRYGRIDLVYYGPGAMDPTEFPKDILRAGSADAAEAMRTVYAAIDVAERVLPGMLERGDGGLLFAGGLSSVLPMPPLGALAVSSAALRNYALTLNAALAERGVYAGTLTIGGLIERGDIHQAMLAAPGGFGDLSAHALDPDALADEAWRLYTDRTRPEATFNALT